MQTWFDGHRTPAHGSIHAPPLQRSPAGHTTPSHGPTHAPSRHNDPAGHGEGSAAHALSMHTPLTHVKPSAQPPSKQRVTQRPLPGSHDVPTGHAVIGRQFRSITASQ